MTPTIKIIISEDDLIEGGKILSNFEKVGLVKSVDYRGRTTLHLAAAYGNADIVQILKKYEAHVNAEDSIFDWTPLENADKYPSWNVAEILLMLLF